MLLSREILETLVAHTHLDHKGRNLYGDCPWCGYNEFGISLEENHPFRCFRGKHCGETGNIFKLLTHLGRTDILQEKGSYRETNIFTELEYKPLIKSSEDLECSLPTTKAPIGWRRITSNNYLESRRFTSIEFGKYQIGMTNLSPKLKGYIVFLVTQNFEIKGYIARSTKSKEEIDLLNAKRKTLNLPTILRYNNSPDTDFSKILFGVDEITTSTKHIIIVEGLFDKINLEIVGRELLLREDVVVCCTWGKKISPVQRKLISDSKVKSVILMYDPDAITDSKKYAFELQKCGCNVRVAFCSDKDPGDLETEEFVKIWSSLANPYQFNLDRLQKRSF